MGDGCPSRDRNTDDDLKKLSLRSSRLWPALFYGIVNIHEETSSRYPHP